MITNRLRIPVARCWLLLLTLGLTPVLTLWGTSVVPPEFADLVKESDYVVRAVVKNVTVEQRAKPGRRAMLYSLVELDVRQVITGTPPTPLILTVLGGRLGGQEMAIAGAPEFKVGEEAIFFVQGNGVQVYPLTRMMHGLYPVHKDATGREYVTRSNGEPLASAAEVSQPLHAEHKAGATLQQAAATALTPDDFTLQIRTKAKELNANKK